MKTSPTRFFLASVFFIFSLSAQVATGIAQAKEIVRSKETAQESLTADHVQVSWVAPETYGTGKNQIGIRFQLDRDWHIYWKNPGDSGAAPKFQVSSGESKISAVRWPYPERIAVGTLTNIGYAKEVVFPFEIQPLASTKEIAVEAKLEWLVCKEECVPGFGTLKLTRAVQGNEPSWNASRLKQIQKYEKRIPHPGEDSPWKVTEAFQDTKKLRLTFFQKNASVSHSKPVSEPEIFPVQGEFFLAQASKPIKSDQSWTFELLVSPGNTQPPRERTADFVLQAGDESWEFSGVRVLGEGRSAPLSPAEPGKASIWILLFFAFLGGLLLNFMPCVFPVLSIKVFSLVKSKTDSQDFLRDALLYSLGVVVSFVILGGAVLVLRQAGAAIGWGFQLQSPSVILLLITLFWVLGMNFLGVFEMGSSVMNWAGRKQQGSSFATGVLSVLVATPCTGPFLGSALGAASVLSAFAAMLVFIAIGLGLASPFLVLALFPGLFRYLPKPGIWMEKLKQFFAYPLFATVLWLIWVLSRQVGETGWMMGGILILSLSFSIWLLQFQSRGVRVVGGFLAVLALSGSLYSARLISVASSKDANTSPESGTLQSEWKSYDRSWIDSEIQKGNSVFIDFTAAWCITCQWNKKSVLETDFVMSLFRENSVKLVRADWTHYDPVITEALREFGRNSIPFYVFYPAQKSEPIFLSTILTRDQISKLFQPTNQGEPQ